MEFLAKEYGKVAVHWSENFADDHRQESLYKALRKMGYSKKQIGF
jgi:hypothetical protein